MNERFIELPVNGLTHKLAVRPNLTLLDVLREDLGLTGTKQGCGIGDCGTCTVLLDGEPVNACLILAVQAAGHEITTIEGVADGNRLHPVQRAFIDHGAVQCGFCTPGMVLVGVALLRDNPDPDADEVREGLAGNLCRCTGYQKIVEAVLDAAAQVRAEGGTP